jgi:isopenicillin N synthase-like dioxygenase
MILSIYFELSILLIASTVNHVIFTVDLSRKIMRGIAMALGGKADAFEGEIAGDPFWVLRLIGYPVDIPEEQRTDTGW